MDIFSTTVTAIHEIYNITVFIRGVVASAKNYDSEKTVIEHKFQHELLFLDSFNSLFFSDDGAFIRNDHLPIYLKLDVHNTIMALRRSLAEYGMIAAKYDFLIFEDGARFEGRDEKTEAAASLYKRVKSKVEDLKKRVFDWALFDKDKMLKVLAEYSAQTERLRQTMSLILLTLTAMGSTELRDFAESKRAKNMRLQNVVRNQLLAISEPPDDFTALDGQLVEIGESSTDSNLKLANYEGDWGQVKLVVVEYRAYDNTMKIAPNGTFEESMAPIRNLAWLLCSSSHLDAQDAVPDISDQSSIFTLPCLGYLDDPDEGRTAFLYQLPRAGDLQPFTDIITLHDRIDHPRGTTGYLPTAKPPLGSRFFLAHALASTMLGIHTFGWVHKNISSRGIIVYPSANHPSSSEDYRLVPYLAGWGYARNIDGRTVLTNDDDTEAEPNFYRHPLRQGQPRDSFKPEHDIYSLGVVLLEIALWRTISCIFKKEIDKVASSGKLPEPERIRKALLDRAREDIPREMGESYARAVERCLLGDFGAQGDDQKQTKLSVSFREHVIDAVAAGSKL